VPAVAAPFYSRTKVPRALAQPGSVRRAGGCGPPPPYSMCCGDMLVGRASARHRGYHVCLRRDTGPLPISVRSASLSAWRSEIMIHTKDVPGVVLPLNPLQTSVIAAIGGRDAFRLRVREEIAVRPPGGICMHGFPGLPGPALDGLEVPATGSTPAIASAQSAFRNGNAVSDTALRWTSPLIGYRCIVEMAVGSLDPCFECARIASVLRTSKTSVFSHQ
jgi:hypothetical protein